MEARPQVPELASMLVRLGCPDSKSVEMALMLEKRARQLADQKGKTFDEALAHLLSLMRQGWNARDV